MCLGYRVLPNLLGATGAKKLGENCSESFQDEILETENVPFPTYLVLSEDGLEMEWGRTLPFTWS